jgi:predicted PolB exonuclease-like 3'-5' exonuclease
MNPTLVFDIETVPDIAGLRALNNIDSRVSDVEVAEMAFQLRRQKTGSDFLQHHLL